MPILTTRPHVPFMILQIIPHLGRYDNIRFVTAFPNCPVFNRTKSTNSKNFSLNFKNYGQKYISVLCNGNNLYNSHERTITTYADVQSTIWGIRYNIINIKIRFYGCPWGQYFFWNPTVSFGINNIFNKLWLSTKFVFIYFLQQYKVGCLITSRNF